MENLTAHANLTNEEKEILIQLFYDMYFNTDQDVEDFAPEFFYTVGAILTGAVPLKLEKLSDEFIQEVIAEIPRLESIYTDLDEDI